jgi:hypothetical protein
MKTPNTDIWQFQSSLSRRLIRWSAGSIVTGAAMLLNPDRRWRGAGAQFIGWGAVDALIAWLGLRSTREKAAAPDAHDRETQQQARTTLRRVLWINTGLDVGYVSAGVVLAKTQGRSDRFWFGSGLGIVVQGGFLLLFDLIHALLLQAEGDDA